MFSTLSALLAPDIPPVEDLKHHWDEFLNYYSTKQIQELKNEPIEGTKLTFHLNKILKILMDEQEELSDAQSSIRLSPCLEYLLHNNVLDILVTLCQADSPPGVRPYIFKVFIFLVEQIRYPILAESSVHQPLRRLVLVCSLTKASPTESQELKFLSVLCSKVREKPDLVHIFLDCGVHTDSSVTPNSFNTSRQDSGRVSRSDSTSPAPYLLNIEKLAINVRAVLNGLKNKHLLCAALLNYLDSADYMLACSCMEALLLVAALPSDLAAQALVTGSAFIPTLMSRLEILYASVPTSIDTARLEEIEVNWMQAHHFHSEEFLDPTFVGRTELVALFSFIDYLDHMARDIHVFSSKTLSLEFRENFLVKHIQPLLLSPVSDLDNLLLGLSYTAQIWIHIKSDSLATSFSSWLLGDDLNSSEITNHLQDSLLNLCKEPGIVGLEAVRLFDVLLSSPCPYILDRLVMEHLESRGYFCHSTNPEGHQVNSWSDVEDEREKQEHLQEDKSTKRELVVTPSRTLAPSNIHRLVNAWLYLVPDQLRLDEIRGSGYDQYVQDATKQVEEIAKECVGFDWPREAAFNERSETSSMDSRCESDPSRQFFEGRFLSNMLDKLGDTLESDYDSNLQLTSIFSRLAQLPHPYLHEYLLNPTIPLITGTRSLYTVLKELLQKAVLRSEEIEHFPRKMYGCRRRLLGENKDKITRDLECSPEEKVLLEAILVIDEFSKELAAVTFVKYHCFT